MISDGKDNNNHVHVINILLSTPVATVFMKTADFSTTERDQLATANLLIQEIRSLEPIVQKCLTAIVTETPSVNVAASKIIEKEFHWVTWIPCLAHVLNLLFKDSLIPPNAARMYSDAKKMTHLFYSRARPRHLLRVNLQEVHHNKIKGVTRVCELRFGNVFMVLSRLQSCRVSLKEVLASAVFETWMKKQKDEIVVQEVVDTVNSRFFGDSVDQYVNVMAPVYKLLREVDTNVIMMGKVYHRMYMLNMHFDEVQQRSAPLYANFSLLDMLVARWNHSIHSDFHSAGFHVKVANTHTYFFI